MDQRSLVDENDALFPKDWWPYGITANQATLDAYLRYHFEQGLSARHWTTQEIFPPELLGS